MTHKLWIILSGTSIILSHDVAEMWIFFDNLRYHKIPFFLLLFQLITTGRIISLNSTQLLYLSACWLFVYLFPDENIKKVFLLVGSQNILNANGGNWKWARGVTDDGQPLTLRGIIWIIILIPMYMVWFMQNHNCYGIK